MCALCIIIIIIIIIPFTTGLCSYPKERLYIDGNISIQRTVGPCNGSGVVFQTLVGGK